MAMDRRQIIDPFHAALYDVLSEAMTTRLAAIGRGAVPKENYEMEVGYLKALNDVLDRCEEIEADRYGPRPGDTKPTS